MASASSPTHAFGHRRPSTRQQKRGPVRDSNNSKDTIGSAKKKTRIDNVNSDINADNLINIDQSSNRSNSTDQQINENSTSKFEKKFVSKMKSLI